MDKIKLKINNTEVVVSRNSTILEAARSFNIYIPVLCSHPDLKPSESVELSQFIYQGDSKLVNDEGATIESIKGCGICVVWDENKSTFLPSCNTVVEEGMIISTENDAVKKRRKDNLSKILSTHPHSCLTCSQREGCIPMTDVCPGSVIKNERCCALLGNCEIQRISDYVGIAPETPRYQFRNLPIVKESPLFNFDYNLCIGCGRCVRVCQQVKGVYALGAVINQGVLKIGTTEGTTLENANCKYCGSCVEVCPTGTITDKRSPKLKEYSEIVPCRAGCPAEVDIPQYLRLISQGKPHDAAEIIAARLTLPAVLGKVCFHPCETNCKRNELGNKGNAVNIRWIKDYALANGGNIKERLQCEPTGKNVAVIGAGPAGLTVAYLLSHKGHCVTVYEKENDLGGMLRYGIPRYRLSEDVLESDLQRIIKSKIKFEFNKSFIRDFSLESLKAQGNDAIFIATGLSQSINLPVSINNNNSIYYGVEFLNSLSKNELKVDVFKDKSIVVIGGGNVAIDVARSALRLKAKDLTIVCLEKSDEMPAYPNEIYEAKEEGINFKNGWGISEIIINSTNSNELKLKQCISVFDNNGFFAPIYNNSIEESFVCDIVIICIGQKISNDIYGNEKINKLISNGKFKVKSDTNETDFKGVFAGGDLVLGPSSVIEAIGSARKAAKNIDLFLGGNGIIDDDSQLNHEYNMFIGRNDKFLSLERINAEQIDVTNRKDSFIPTEITYNEQEAIFESSRCLQCDLRLHLKHNPHPPEKYLIFRNDVIESLPQFEGVIQIFNKNKEILVIKGTENIRETMQWMSGSEKDYFYFIYEQDPMFTKRESELIQQYLQKYGKLPDSGDDLDDLF